ncbi:EAL domain-containing protein [Uliginosibacterium sp. 31-12]|uniref:EAL domain-containing response regulator n=1 Tax=Uliginosibacterium sp. 31-12 TaxID=3062781 RepID=UPI0026E22401|nr:EAL domain-containing protein [Uliginosibacterium sp. 31-12]MDO6385160.1 EAL domain-containing protein [Uliginosibacterium sp. 31-12]
MSSTLEQGDAIAQAGDMLEFVDEALAHPVKEGPAPWKILITDDDDEVHRATAFALRGFHIDERPLELLHAYSAREAEAMLREHPGVAVAMLDVVMETPDAGLRLVDTIRNELGMHSVRIVLRTGQPGYAPELEVIRRYDINDYRTKSELSQTRLITTLTAAVRAYEQIETVRAANRGMDAVSRAANTVFRLRSSVEFSRVLLERVEEILGEAADALVAMEHSSATPGEAGLHVVCGRGRYANLAGCAIERSVDVEMQRGIRRCLAAHTCVFEAGRFLLWLGNGGRDAVVVVDHPHPLRSLQQRLVEMFAASLGVGFENVDLIERLDFFAFYDPLTHLPNRTCFINEVDQDLLVRQGGSRCLALADVVRFSEINDALGYRCGDTLLVAVAKRLRSALGPGVTLARVSGDTFGIFGPENALDPALINKAFEQAFFVHGHALTVQLRIGLVRLAECKGNAVELMRNASLALNQARQAGGSAFSVFSAMMSDDVQTRVAMLHSLRAAIDFKRGLSLCWQPIVQAGSGELQGLEVLLRWRNDFGELVPPARFIPLAERTGMVHELGQWVLGQALERFGIWRRQGWRGLELTLNISSVQLRDERFVQRLRAQLEYSDVEADRLVLDLDESLAFEEPRLLQHQLRGLRELGVRLALDNFGCGRASLSQLGTFPVDRIKLDRNLLANFDETPEATALPAAIAELACKRKLVLMGEGVESAAQASMLETLGCSLLQGFHFARPMAAEQMDAWLRERRSNFDAL